MSGEEKLSSNESNSVRPWQIGLLFALLAVFAPAFLVIYWASPNSSLFHVWGMLWWLTPNVEQGGWNLSWQNPFFIIIRSVVYTLLRPVFAYQMVRFYRNKSSKKLTFLVGLLTELQVVVIGIFSRLPVPQLYLELIIPIPFLLLVGILVMRFMPPQKRPEHWLEREEEDHTMWNHDENNAMAD